MITTTSRDDVLAWALAAADGADDKKGLDTLILEVGAVLPLTDFFVITSATNPRQVRTIADEVDLAVRTAGGPHPRIEGQNEASWVLLDFADLVVHVFLDETRRFYDLERLWRDVPVIGRQPKAPSEV